MVDFNSKKKLLEQIIKAEKDLEESEALLKNIKDGTLKSLYYIEKNRSSSSEISFSKHRALGFELKKVLINVIEDEIQISKIGIFNLKKLF